jgi:hypothetical protein
VTPCKEWTLSLGPKGYGQVNDSGRMRRAHRWVWEKVYGPVPHGLFVLHRCDNKRCVFIEHLFLGTAADNSADMRAKGRSRGAPKGQPWSVARRAAQEIKR